MKTNLLAHGRNMLLMALFTLALASCKDKVSDLDPDNPEPVNLLTEKWWQVESIVIDPKYVDDDGNEYSDLFQFYDDCSKDDRVMLKKSGKSVSHYGSLRCDDEPEQEETGTWTYTHFSKTLIIEYLDGATEIWVVKQSTPDKLVLDNKVTFPGYIVTMTLKKS